MWTAKHTLETTALTETVWRRLCDVRTWPEWDLDLASAVLDGKAAAGATGVLLTRAGTRRPFRLDQVTERLTFAMTIRLTGAELVSVHTLEPSPLGTRITRSLELKGTFAWYHAWVRGRRLRESLAPTLRMLARVAHLD